MTRLIIVDDQPILRYGMAEAAESIDNLEVVGATDDFDEAIKLARTQRADLAMVDIFMRKPDLGGLQFTLTLSEILPDVRVLVFTNRTILAHIQKCDEIGVAGYILKTEPVSMVIESIRSVANGGVVYSRRVRDILSGRSENYQPALTTREAEILQLAAEGLETIEIARELSLSRTTIQQSLTMTYQKLEVNGRLEAVLKAARQGLVAIQA